MNQAMFLQQQNLMFQNNMPQMQPQQQQQNFINNMNTTPPVSPDSNNICIIFKLQVRDDLIKTFSIQCTLNDKVSDVIKAFRNKANDFNFQHEKFIFNAKQINQTLTVAEAGMSNNSIIFVINDENLVGGFFL